MDVIGKKVVIKAWGRLGTKDGILYEEKGQLKFTDGFHDKKLTEERAGKSFQMETESWRKHTRGCEVQGTGILL